MTHLHDKYSGKCVPHSDEPHGETVEHCNQRTEYESIQHVYDPGKCSECDIISMLYLLHGFCERSENERPFPRIPRM